MKSDAIAEPRSLDDAPSSPAPGEIHIWRIELAGEGQRAAARAALGAILAAYLGGRAPALAAGPAGKPQLAEAPERLSFNLSHSGGLALVAVAAGAVGVDVEELKPRRDLARLARRWLPAADAEAVVAAPEAGREPVFYAAWTRHEARVKCTGAGLAGPSPDAHVVARQLEIDTGYTAAVAFDLTATGGKEPRIEIRDG